MTDLWSFAVALYARPGVEQACLKAQDRGSNVCLLLCAAWLDAGHVARTAVREEALWQLAQAHEADITAPLRHLRTSWREAAARDEELAALRETIRQLELQSERMLCERLQRLRESWQSLTRTEERGTWLQALADEGELQHLLREHSRALAGAA